MFVVVKAEESHLQASKESTKASRTIFDIENQEVLAQPFQKSEGLQFIVGFTCVSNVDDECSLKSQNKNSGCTRNDIDFPL